MAKDKEVSGFIKLQIPAGQANPAPPVGQALGIQKGSGVPQRDKVGTLTQAQLTEIAETKLPDLNANDIEAAKKIVAGTARSMGVLVEE